MSYNLENTKVKHTSFGVLQNMYFGLEIFSWSLLYFCVVDFRKAEGTLFHDSSNLIGV